MSRWAELPSELLPLRRELIAWRKGDAQLVKGWCDRQGTIPQEWIRARAHEYLQQFTTEKGARLWHEAALDLVAWQRGGLTPRAALEWLRTWEENLRNMA